MWGESAKSHGDQDISDRGSSKVRALSRACTMSYERWYRREQQRPNPEAQECGFVLRGHRSINRMVMVAIMFLKVSRTAGYQVD